MAEPYIPLSDPFWSDGVFAVWERANDRFTASRINGDTHYRGDLQGCARWIERERSKGA